MLAAKQLFSIVALSAFLTIASAQAHSGCTDNGTVQDGETCDIFSARHDVSTFQLRHANPVINTLCDNLFPGEELCLGLADKDCIDVVDVQSGDSCISIATAVGIPVSTLIANNPNVNSDCTNIYIGEVLCAEGEIINYDCLDLHEGEVSD